MLGCKFSIGSIIYALFRELIDTCWDVNYFREMGLTNVKNELIDTCWDVN